GILLSSIAYPGPHRPREEARMAGSASARPGTSIPLFPLYGERTPWQAPDLVHCETIASRSRRHGWVIAPHRHADLAQLLWVGRGRVAIQLDGREHRAQGPVLQFVPPLCVHGFVFSEDVQGHVVRSEEHTSELQSRE